MGMLRYRSLALMLVLQLALCLAADPSAPVSGAVKTSILQDWKALAALCIFGGFMLLAVMYAIAEITNNQQLSFLAKDEVYQLVVSLAIFALLAGAEAFMDSGLLPFFSNHAFYGQGYGTFYDFSYGAVAELKERTDSAYTDIFVNMAAFSREGSKSGSCGFEGLYFTIAPCGGYRGAVPAHMMALQALGVGAIQLEGLSLMLSFGAQYAICILLPLGLLLRSFNITRGAGGLLIAAGVGFYFFLPVTLLTFTGLAEEFAASRGIGSVDNMDLPSPSCDSFANNGSNAREVVRSFDSFFSNSFEATIFFVFGEVTLTTVICLAVLFAGINKMSQVFGVPVDVSPLVRLM